MTLELPKEEISNVARIVKVVIFSGDLKGVRSSEGKITEATDFRTAIKDENLEEIGEIANFKKTEIGQEIPFGISLKELGNFKVRRVTLVRDTKKMREVKVKEMIG